MFAYKMQPREYFPRCNIPELCPPNVTYLKFWNDAAFLRAGDPSGPVRNQWPDPPPIYTLEWQHRTSKVTQLGFDLFDVFSFVNPVMAVSEEVAVFLSEVVVTPIELLPIQVQDRTLYLLRVLHVLGRESIDYERSVFSRLMGSDLLLRAHFKLLSLPQSQPAMAIHRSDIAPRVEDEIQHCDCNYIYINEPMKHAIDARGGLRGALILPADELGPSEESSMKIFYPRKRSSEPAPPKQPLPRPDVEEEPASVVASLRRRAPRGQQLLGNPDQDMLLEALDQRLYDMQAQWADDEDRIGLLKELKNYAALLAVICMDEFAAIPVRYRPQGTRQWRKDALLLPDGRTLICCLELLQRMVEEEPEPAVGMTLTLIASEPEPNPDDPNDPGHDTHMIYIR